MSGKAEKCNLYCESEMFHVEHIGVTVKLKVPRGTKHNKTSKKYEKTVYK